MNKKKNNNELCEFFGLKGLNRAFEIRKKKH